MVLALGHLPVPLCLYPPKVNDIMIVNIVDSINQSTIYSREVLIFFNQCMFCPSYMELHHFLSSFKFNFYHHQVFCIYTLVSSSSLLCL